MHFCGAKGSTLHTIRRVAGSTVLRLSQLDASVLEALPEDLRAEVVAEYSGPYRAARSAPPASQLTGGAEANSARLLRQPLAASFAARRSEESEHRASGAKAGVVASDLRPAPPPRDDPREVWAAISTALADLQQCFDCAAQSPLGVHDGIVGGHLNIPHGTSLPVATAKAEILEISAVDAVCPKRRLEALLEVIWAYCESLVDSDLEGLHLLVRRLQSSASRWPACSSGTSDVIDRLQRVVVDAVGAPLQLTQPCPPSQRKSGVG